MPFLPDLNGEFCLRLTLTLLHFLWQGAAIALLAAGAGAALRRAGAAARYWVFVVALGAMALCPAVTFRALAPRPDVQRVIPNTVDEPVAPLSQNALPVSSTTALPGVSSEIQPVAMGSASVSSPPLAPAPSRSVKERLLEVLSSDTYRTVAPWVAGGYFVGVLAMLARLLLALRGGRGLRRHARPVTEPALRAMFERAATAVRLSARPALAWCERVAVPTVVGLLKPTILLPVSLSSGLSPEQVEMLLLHELAHLRRHDHWVNLAQWVVETAMFFHPAVWWVSRRIRAERELACDDCVLATGVAEASYADSLLRMAELSRLAATPSDPTVALALGSHGSRFSEFGHRVLRLIEGRESLESLRPTRVWPVTVAVLILLGGCFSVALHDKGEELDGLSPKPVKIRFSNGVEAELAGVGEVIGEPQPDGEIKYSLPSKRYWSPDGRWTYPEISDFKYSESSLVQESEGQIVRQFCLRLNRPGAGDIAARYKIDRKSPSFSGCSGNPQKGTYLLSGTSSLPEKPRTVDLELGVAAGRWKTLLKTGERGGSENRQDYSVAVSPLSQQGTQWSVTVSHNLDGDKKDCRVVATDDQGNSHVAIQTQAATGTGFIQSVFEFRDIPETAKIVRVEFQTRDYEWRTIRNVHLYPDPDATDPDESKTGQTRIVAWNLIVDAPLAQALKEQATETSGTETYRNYRVDSDTLMRVLQTGEANSQILIVSPDMEWFDMDRNFPGEKALARSRIVTKPLGKDRERRAIIGGNEFYKYSKEENGQPLSWRGSGNISLSEWGTQSSENYHASLSGEYQFTGTLNAGDAIIQLASLSGGMQPEPSHLIIHQALSIPNDIFPDFKSVNASKWLEGGEEGVLRHIRQVREWEKKNSSSSDAGEGRWSSKTPAGKTIRVVAVSQPSRWPGYWWDADGKTVKHDPSWDSQDVGHARLAVVVEQESLDEFGGYNLRLNPNDRTGGNGIGLKGFGYSNTSRVRQSLLFIDESPSPTGPEQDPTPTRRFVQNPFDVELANADETWEEVGMIREGETQKLSDGSFSLEEVKPTPSQILVLGRFTCNPAYEIALVSVDKQGRQSERVVAYSQSLDSPPEQKRALEGFIPVDKKDVDHFVILRRPLQTHVFKGIAPTPTHLPDEQTNPNSEGTATPVKPTPEISSSSLKQELQIEVDRIEQQSSDGHRLLVADGETLLRIENERFSTETGTNGRIRLTASGSEAFPLKVGVLLTGGENNETRLERIYTIAATHPSVQTFYILQQGWDRELVEIPTALVVPQGMKESPDWKKWKKVKDIRNLEYTDEVGRKYVLQGLGWEKSGETESPTIPRLERYRPDGTLEAFSVYMESQPEQCFFYGWDGKTRTGYLTMDLKRIGSKQTPGLRDFTWRDPEGKYHQHATATQGVFPFEWAGNLDENKMFSIDKLINGKNELVNEPFHLDAAKALGEIKPLLQPGPKIPAPPLKLEVHAYQKKGEPIAVEYSVGAWEWEIAGDCRPSLRIDGKEVKTGSGSFREGFSVTAFLNEGGSQQSGEPIWLSPGKHRISAIARNVKVRPKWTIISDPAPAVATTFDEVVSNEVEYEVVDQIPPDYFQKVYQEGWEEILRQKFDGIRYSTRNDPINKYAIELDWGENLPVNLAFDVAIQQEGDNTTHSLTKLTRESGKPASGEIFASNTLDVLIPKLANQRVRLLMTPSIEAASKNPSVRTFYGKPFVTGWISLKPDIGWLSNEVRNYGVSNSAFSDQKSGEGENQNEQLGIILRKGTEGGGVKVLPGRSVRLLAFPGGTLPWDAMRIVGRDPEKLRQSTVQEVPALPDQVVCVAILTEAGETWFMMIDASASLDQRFRWWKMGHGLERVVIRTDKDDATKRFVATLGWIGSGQILFENARGQTCEMQWQHVGGNASGRKYRFSSRVLQENGQWQDEATKEIEYQGEDRVTVFAEKDAWVLSIEVQPWTEDEAPKAETGTPEKQG